MEATEAPARQNEPLARLQTGLYWLAAVTAAVWPLVRPQPVPVVAVLLAVVPLLATAKYLDKKIELKRAQVMGALFWKDSLTGVGNRRFFMEELRRALMVPIKEAQVTAVFYLDVDRFKGINDTLGHVLGDRFLKIAADRLRECTPDSAVIARMGGDEFTILLGQCPGREEVIAIANEILKSFDESMTLNGQTVWASVSIGIVIAGRPRPLADDFISMSDSALYQAKSQGKARFVLFEPQVPRPTQRTAPLEMDLRTAPSTNQLLLHYQPIVDLSDMTVSGFEALVRWNHPRLGLLAPSEFIHLAEETGLIREVGEWIIERACAVTSAWQSICGRVLTISVNLSALQFRQADILELIAASSLRVGLMPGSLQLEITETVLMLDDEMTMANLRGLREMGMTIAIDDFGVGYSSLSYLKLFEVDALKIDRSFVTGIQDARSFALTKAICQLGQTLGHTIIAEGIETEEQLAALKEIGCDKGQGFLLGRPMEESRVTELLAGRGVHGLLVGDHGNGSSRAA